MTSTVSPSRRLIPLSEYVKTLRPLLPPEAFRRDPSKLGILLINLAILILGWAIASYLDQWPVYLLPLFLPLSLIMGNSVIVLLFTSHDMLHGSVIKNGRLSHFIGFLGLIPLWMPPSLWKTLHNQVHHGNTNSLRDPDRSYHYEDPNTWGKWIQNAFVPSSTVSWWGLLGGWMSAWGIYTFRHITAVLLFNRESVSYVPASFAVSEKKRRAIAFEVFLLIIIHLGIMAFLHFDPIKLILAYFLPICLGYAGVISYIYTNHMLSPMTPVNDPLLNSVSLRLPKILDVLHFNFSYHAEHHIFPNINSNYYPLLRELIQEQYPDRTDYLWDGVKAWQYLLKTPRHYQENNTLTTFSGNAATSVKIPHQS